MAGRVRVNGAPVTKAGTPTADDASVELIAPPRYVSRGGEKLETALAAFGVDVAGERCLDVGSVDGRVHGLPPPARRRRVVALDVGRNQLHERLRADPRVTVLDGTNARSLDCGALPFRPGFVTADVSFISLRLVLPAVLACAADPWRALVLVKPQFEAGRGDVRRGVVRDPEVRRQGVAGFLRVCDLQRLGRPRRVRFLCPGAGRKSRVPCVPRVACAPRAGGPHRRCRRPDRTCARRVVTAWRSRARPS